MVIYACSKSILKMEVLNYISEFLSKKFNQENFKLIASEIENFDTVNQPINNTIYESCKKRLDITIESLRNTLTNNDLIISLENGLIYNSEYYYDVCVMLVCYNGSIYCYKSFGIEIDETLINYYNNEHPSNGTFGEFLHNKFGAEPNNWMKDPRFGNVDRKIQMNDVANKFLIDFCSSTIPDFPRQGVLFKDITSVMVDEKCLTILFDTMKRFIIDNFDLNKIDYFAGLDARGFYFAPTLALFFNKGFLPLRKANKVPKNIRCTNHN